MDYSAHQTTTSPAQRSALVLGATGGFGRAICACMIDKGWQIKALSRKAREPQIQLSDSGNSKRKSASQVEWVTGDLTESGMLNTLAANVDVIVHAVNVPYPKWDPLMLDYTRSIIDAAIASGAHLLFVGNIYNAGIPENGVIDENTIDAPINSKGEIRSELERMIRVAATQGLRATIMRFGDFFGPDIPTSNWFNECTKGVGKNKLNYGTSVDTPHTWAYLPDAALACEQVINIRMSDSKLPAHMVLPFAGHVFSFKQLQQTIEAINGKTIRMSSLPWGLFKALSLVMPVMLDIVSMRYLWEHDIRMDGRALEQLLGHPPRHTPLKGAVLASVPGLKG